MLGPGTILMKYFSDRKIRPYKGCSCYPLAKRMDMNGPEKVQEDIEAWTDSMKESIKGWKKFSNNRWSKFICPPRFIVRGIINWACKESKKSKQENIDG